MRRTVDTLLHDPNLDDLPTLIERLLGRPIQDAADWVGRHDRILLVPFPFMGPYLLSMTVEEQEPAPMMILAFDAERALNLRTAVGPGPDILKLKALADETRLMILRFVSTGERFGGDIVTHLGISQPGVFGECGPVRRRIRRVARCERKEHAIE
jgi:hypothetical protein